MRHHFARSFRVALTCGLGLGMAAQQASALFIVNQPWIRPAQKLHSTEVYMNLTSTDGASLVGVASAASATASILAPGTSAHVVERMALPARKLVALAPGGYRIVMHRLARSLKLNDRVRLTLTIEAADGTRQAVGVDAEVRFHAPIDDEMHEHMHAH